MNAKASGYRLFALIAPLICLLVAVGTMLGQYFRLKSLEEETVQTESSIKFVKELIADMGAQPIISKVLSVPATPDEQAVFLDQLRGYAALRKVDLARWVAIPAAVARPANSDVVQPAQEAGPPGPMPLVSTVDITGTYIDARAFLYDLLKAERLLNLTKVRWERGQMPNPERTKVSFTLTRYVSPQGTMNPALAAKAPTDTKGTETQ